MSTRRKQQILVALVMSLITGFANHIAPSAKEFQSSALSSVSPELVLQIGHIGLVRAIAFSPDGNLLASASTDKTVRLWDAQTGELKRTLSKHKAAVDSVVFSPDAKTLVSATSGEQAIIFWDAQSGEVKRTLILPDPVEAVAFSPNGNTLAIGTDRSINLCNVQTGEIRWFYNSSIEFPNSLAFSPNGLTIVTGGLKIWDARTGKLRRSLKVPKSDEINTGREKRITLRDAGDVSAVAFSPDGKTLATEGSNKIVKLWDTRTGQIKRTLTGHDDEANCVAFSPKGDKVASGSSDRTVRVWDVRNGRLLVTFMILPARKQDMTSTDWIAFTPEGYYASSPGAASFIRWRVGDTLFSAETYERIFHRPDLVQKTLQSEH